MKSRKDTSRRVRDVRLSAPAHSALEAAGIRTLEELSEFTEGEVLRLHGVGPASIPRLHAALKEAGLDFRR